MRQETLLNSAIKEIDNTCGPCPKSNNKQSCGFGYSALKSSDLHADALVQATIIHFDWLECDQAKDCPKPQDVLERMQKLKQELNRQS